MHVDYALAYFWEFEGCEMLRRIMINSGTVGQTTLQGQEFVTILCKVLSKSHHLRELYLIDPEGIEPHLQQLGESVRRLEHLTSFALHISPVNNSFNPSIGSFLQNMSHLQTLHLHLRGMPIENMLPIFSVISKLGGLESLFFHTDVMSDLVFFLFLLYLRDNAHLEELTITSSRAYKLSTPELDAVDHLDALTSFDFDGLHRTTQSIFDYAKLTRRNPHIVSRSLPVNPFNDNDIRPLNGVLR